MREEEQNGDVSHDRPCSRMPRKKELLTCGWKRGMQETTTPHLVLLVTGGGQPDRFGLVDRRVSTGGAMGQEQVREGLRERRQLLRE